MRRAAFTILGIAAGTAVVIGVRTRPAARRPARRRRRRTPAPHAARLPPGTYVVTGTVQRTPHGRVQVRISVTGGRLTDVVALQLPTGGRSTEINQSAVPMLRQEALTAQSADIDGVAGATYTSTGYVRSLQAALDAAAHGRRG